jgi:hypothetical protein
MIREILKSDKNSLTLNLPDDLVGRLIEVIAFPVEDEPGVSETKLSDADKKSFRDKIKAFAFNSGGYKFNRDDANDYE